MLLKVNNDLIENARLIGHDMKNGRVLSDLELLAELQHFGAATCLIDFTRNSLIALWFACQEHSHSKANGKVSAVLDVFRKVNTVLIKKDIDYFYTSEGSGIYKWDTMPQNNRIIAQQSVFIFGRGRIDPEECVIDKESKSAILKSLKQLVGIAGSSMFPDFDGFARMYGQDNPYKDPDIQTYMQHGEKGLRDFSMPRVIRYNTGIIDLYQQNAPAHPEDYNNLFNAYANRAFAISVYTADPGNSINDYTKAIDLISHVDIGSASIAEVYCGRGDAFISNGNYTDAIDDYNDAIELNLRYAYAYFARGFAKIHTNNMQQAEDDLVEAKMRGYDIVASFHRYYDSVEDFKQKTGLNMTDDIKKLLADIDSENSGISIR